MLKLMTGLFILLAGCAIDDVDPVGTWSFSGKYGAGNCFAVGGMAANSIKVTQGAQGGYQFQNAFPGVTTTGSINCNARGCAMSASETSSATGTTNVWSLTLTPDDAITGSGSMTGTNPSCSQALIDITGSRT
jgi:hypothetical protein